MNLTSLDKLTGFISKSFFISVILPWFVALAFNVFFAEWAFQGLTNFLIWYEVETDNFKGIFILFAFLSFVTLGLLTKPVIPILWQILEGQHIPFFSCLLRSLQLDEWEQAMELEEYKNEVAAIEKKFSGDLQCKWKVVEEKFTNKDRALRGNNFQEKLKTCMVVLQKLKNGLLDFQALKNDGKGLVFLANEFIEESQSLEQSYDRAQFEQMNCIDELCREFNYVMKSISYTLEFHLIEETIKYGDAFPREHKGVTRFANIGQATRSHIFACYGIDSNFFWSRFVDRKSVV